MQNSTTFVLQIIKLSLCWLGWGILRPILYNLYCVLLCSTITKAFQCWREMSIYIKLKIQYDLQHRHVLLSTTNMVWRKQKYSNAFVKSLASEERHDGNIVPDVLREGAERRAQSRNIYIYIFHNIGSRNSSHRYFIIFTAQNIGSIKIDVSYFS